MPETFADVAEGILHCYHPGARYHAAELVESPWDHDDRDGADASALIRILYWIERSADVHEMNVGLLGREDRVRTTLVSDDRADGQSANCKLESWTRLEP